jgi:hypothetical protein
LTLSDEERERILAGRREEDEARREQYRDLEDALLEAVPEATEEYEEWYTISRGWPGLYLTVSGPLCRVAKALISAGGSAEDLRRVFDFVERLANHPDEYVTNMVATGFCEYIRGHGYLHQAWQHMGPVTKRMAHRMAAAWGHPLPEEYEEMSDEIRTEYRARWRAEQDRLARPIRHGELERITARLFREFGVRPYCPFDEPPS